MSKTTSACNKVSDILRGQAITAPTSAKLDLVTAYTNLKAGSYTIASYTGYAGQNVINYLSTAASGETHLTQNVEFPVTDQEIVVKRVMLSLYWAASGWIPWVYAPESDYTVDNGTVEVGRKPLVTSGIGFSHTEV